MLDCDPLKGNDALKFVVVSFVDLAVGSLTELLLQLKAGVKLHVLVRAAAAPAVILVGDEF